MNATVQTANQNCPTWCLHHEPGVQDLCIGPAVELDFGAANPGNSQNVHHARIITYNEPSDGITISLVFNSTDSGDLTPQQARQIGAVLIQAADATEAGAR